mmetsp:Transcript_28530/g.57459  ORF Transcript_28530/g.57459 Transcript_28530/m.57459 type:complete len:160 (+) Transcript_28530:39-518(+)|eukprot:CAMPEP_0171979310 /NCGR_PEP_ID=MMETSP0993-20121228/256230_1 /TAXON_ID=483369 /ORGANISM="non described non described, Strain CCMP2098" /LENGTH=159 /DNA_ID=CAMNT_0012631385 /DNA_START=31 /DNA_END=510 /DNA_ORIENTATION=+
MGSGATRGYHETMDEQVLLSAAARGDVQACVSLIQKGTNPNAQNFGTRWTPLHFAARAGNVELVATLLANGADPNVQNKAGNTAMMVAENHGKDEVLSLFFADLGADLGNVDNTTHNALIMNQKSPSRSDTPPRTQTPPHDANNPASPTVPDSKFPETD